MLEGPRDRTDLVIFASGGNALHRHLELPRRVGEQALLAGEPVGVREAPERRVAGVGEDVCIPPLAENAHVIDEQVPHTLVAGKLVVLDLALVHVDVIVARGAKLLLRAVEDVGKLMSTGEILRVP